ncbi:glycosyltransferase family 9 protein [Pseudodesulfovibrio sp.]|uniref:glycosyltransferase family 9 protein n=1 Tax=Pseudodesulfovibrio sp. TaxID=2035812 RepID=UPI002610E965|nr:glycosyltransferase family 9 protein [Pseudodesulfovibrio sp.]MDD3311642.1 glycosyltransferase family 9 protein [Pseudodesulfovibrio sp.]
MDAPRKIAVWQTAFLGDAVLTLPLLRALNLRFPEAEVHFFVRRGFEPLFAAQPGVTAVRGFDKRGAQKSLPAAVRLGRALGREGFDLWIGTHKSLRSALVAGSTGIVRRVGYDAPWFNRLAYTDVVPRRFDELEEVERLFQLLRPLGIKTPAPEATLVLPEDARAAANGFWAGYTARRPVLGIHPGSTWPTKCWPVEYFGEVARRARKAGARVLVFGGPGEEPVAARVAALARRDGDDGDGIADLSGKLSLPELAAYLGKCDACLTNDSGPMHLAWVQGAPLTALFGPTVRSLGFFPRGKGSTVMEIPLDCRPCGLHGPRKCPLDHHRCMGDLSPDAVWENVRGKLGL